MIRKPNKGDRWTKEEMIVVLNLYFKLPYGQMDHRNASVKELASLMGRTANSVAMRLNNFASCDPYHISRGIKSLGDHRKQCQPFWDEYINNKEKLVFESEKILAEYQEVQIEDKYQSILQSMPKGLVGEDRVREIRTRVNQSFFRKMVLVNYNYKCALTGIDLPELLVASHIIPWASNVDERLNPQNGICLSALFDKAFDRGLISFDNDYRVMFSNQIEMHIDDDYYGRYFLPVKNKVLCESVKYLPNIHFLEWHRNNIFIG